MLYEGSTLEFYRRSQQVSCVAVEMKFPYISRFHDFPDQNVNIFTRSYSKFPTDILVEFLDFLFFVKTAPESTKKLILRYDKSISGNIRLI